MSRVFDLAGWSELGLLVDAGFGVPWIRAPAFGRYHGEVFPLARLIAPIAWGGWMLPIGAFGPCALCAGSLVLCSFVL